MEKTALRVGGLLVVVGLIGMVVHLFKNDGAILVAGAVIFAAGVISKAINTTKEP